MITCQVVAMAVHCLGTTAGGGWVDSWAPATLDAPPPVAGSIYVEPYQPLPPLNVPMYNPYYDGDMYAPYYPGY